jgi:predicted RNA-binding protein with TRAM domain
VVMIIIIILQDVIIKSDIHQNNSFSKPVEIGNEYVVDITDTGRDAEGVTRIGGLIIFVKNAKAGDNNID